ncbi:hypothetical protein LCGC14_1953700 [marine sediment metagenome]|uniref:Uncharacterized protein n=1 Tax=marine sediment metagenome TaxID=412755 RepID=A0A0F9FGZ5_9ZZZZ
MKLVTKCPIQIMEAGGTIGIDVTYTRANWELARLEEFVKHFDVDSYDCEWTDKGLIEDDYVSVFLISPRTAGFKSLYGVLERLRDMAAPADLSNC